MYFILSHQLPHSMKAVPKIRGRVFETECFSSLILAVESQSMSYRRLFSNLEQHKVYVCHECRRSKPWKYAALQISTPLPWLISAEDEDTMEIKVYRARRRRAD